MQVAPTRQADTRAPRLPDKEHDAPPMALIRRIQSHEMGTGKVLPTMITLGLPAAIGGLMQNLFEMTDTLFISWLGKDAISGVSVVWPLLFTLFALGQAVNVGISALLSRRLGEGRPDRARDVLNHGLFISALVGGLLTIALSIALALRSEPILRAAGASDTTYPYARDFAQIIIFGVLLMYVGVAADGALRAQGNAITPMKVGIIANACNVILNPILIFGLHMGVRGSATATLITRSAMCIVLLSRLWTRSSEVKPGHFLGVPLRERLRIIGSIYWVGIPSSVGMLAMSLSMVAINSLLSGMDPYAVGVLGIASRVEMFALVPVFALFSAVLPMVGYSLGARNYNRIREIVWTAGRVGAVAMGVPALIIFLIPAAFFGIFSRDADMLRMGVEYLRIMMPAYPVIGAQIMMSAGFQGLGRSWIAMIMHLFRNIVLKLPFAYWFAALWGLAGVWWSMPASSFASAGFAFAWMYVVLRGLGPR